MPREVEFGLNSSIPTVNERRRLIKHGIGDDVGIFPIQEKKPFASRDQTKVPSFRTAAEETLSYCHQLFLSRTEFWLLIHCCDRLRVIVCEVACKSNSLIAFPAFVDSGHGSVIGTKVRLDGMCNNADAKFCLSTRLIDVNAQARA